MQRSTERAFGKIPDWAKLGPISLKNYDYRAEAHMALHSVKRASQHPTITRQSPEFLEWFEYFERHLGDLNWAMNALWRGQIGEMTVPEERPQWFDSSFAPTPGYRVSLPDQEAHDDPVRNERMREKFTKLLVALAAKSITSGGKQKFPRYTVDDLRKIYARNTAEPTSEAAE